MKSRERFDTYRRIFATADDSVVCWWYSGLSYVLLAERPEIPVSQISAIMTFRTETLSPDSFRVHWSEIGVFFDPVTGDVPGPWMNSVTGQVVHPPLKFLEGPGAYVVHAAEDGVRLELEQPSARVLELRVEFDETDERISFVQLERKQRGYPRPDGSLPTLETVAGLNAFTELSFYARKTDLARPASENLAVQGTYRFTLCGIPPWMGFGGLTGITRTIGSITRARPGVRLNARAWQLLEEHFPREIVDPPAAR